MTISLATAGLPADAPKKPKRHGGEKRGNSYARRARKNKMLRLYGPFCAEHTTEAVDVTREFDKSQCAACDETKCACVHCGDLLTFETVEADRIIPGGTYRWENVQPACRRCNLQRSDNADWTLATS